jgi:riboflavin-specific deaminase-like protein
VAINMVSTIDGRATVGGKAAGLGGAADRELMRLLRASADAVMVGAGTIRAERMSLSIPEELSEERRSRGMRARPLAVVLTSTGSLPLASNLVSTPGEDLIVLSSPEAEPLARACLPDGARVETVSPATGGAGGLDLAEVLGLLLRRHGVGSLLVEGGPSLNHALVDRDLVDDLFLTIAPKVVGGPAETTIVEGPESVRQDGWDEEQARPNRWRLVSSHLSADGDLFLKYARAQEPKRPAATADPPPSFR